MAKKRYTAKEERVRLELKKKRNRAYSYLHSLKKKGWAAEVIEKHLYDYLERNEYITDEIPDSMQEIILRELGRRASKEARQSTPAIPTPPIPSAEQEIREHKSRNIARIVGHELGDGCIKIVAASNFLTYQDIKQKYGEEVLRVYLATFPSMTLEVSSDGKRAAIGVSIKTNYGIRPIIVGRFYTKSDFNSIVKLMKQSGKNLVQAIRSVKESEAKTDFVIEI